LQAYLKKNPDAQKNRAAVLEEQLAEAKRRRDRGEIRGICKNIIALYGKEDDMKKFVQQAKDLLEKVG
jgi:hypothetical protein